ncbi:MAG: glycosyltransferase, partial [Clostridium sp.]
YRIKTSINLRVNKILKKTMDSEQIVYNSINPILKGSEKEYDTAIAYSQGFPTYFVSEKVKARKKLAWINCDYVSTKYDKDIDNKFYNNIDNIIAVSQFAYESISKMKYGYSEKLIKILDVVDPILINKLALNEENMELDESEFNIVTVGRLVTVKGYDLAVNAAKLLKESGYKFKWYIIGEGPQRSEIENQIKENKVENEFILLGTKTNPYPYMKNCNLYVQTSRREGFGLTVIEAKILKSVIITTNFNTATELIENNKDGYIVSKNSVNIYDAIVNVMTNTKEYKTISDNIKNSGLYSSVSEMKKIYQLL